MERGWLTIQASVSGLSESCSRCRLVDLNSPSQEHGWQVSQFEADSHSRPELNLDIGHFILEEAVVARLGHESAFHDLRPIARTERGANRRLSLWRVMPELATHSPGCTLPIAGYCGQDCCFDFESC